MRRAKERIAKGREALTSGEGSAALTEWRRGAKRTAYKGKKCYLSSRKKIFIKREREEEGKGLPGGKEVAGIERPHSDE